VSVCKRVCECVSMLESVWVCVSACECVWVCVSVCECVWVCVWEREMEKEWEVRVSIKLVTHFLNDNCWREFSLKINWKRHWELRGRQIFLIKKCLENKKKVAEIFSYLGSRLIKLAVFYVRTRYTLTQNNEKTFCTDSL